MLNLFFGSGLVPQEWKHARVILFLKKPTLDPSLSENLRPISQLPLFAKIAEKPVNQQLVNFVEEKALLHERQSGFRPSFSTESVLLESLRGRANNGKMAALVMLDLSAAFNSVPRSLLLDRLCHAGVGRHGAWLACKFS